ncbi:G-box-binding factor 1-like isoform X2 [Cornus florida]|uniref:G-box-binding factor 1-like isoform X2 n=1 Tax=Cornus florida TaxID=4283 RepID=UPI002897F16D|nr:G-box-binding factor 1-like isoform X2 [Cornus florida]
MKAGEENSPAKSSRPTGLTQETPTTPLYPDWTASMQAYYGAGATPSHFFASPVASQAPHPYLWGSQHPMVPPYGTPLPYPAFYPHGGLYAHPNMAVGATLTNTEAEGKASDGNELGCMKKSNGTPGITGLIGSKSGESEKAASASGNDGASQSAESYSDRSSEASDENDNQQASSATKKRNFNQRLADGNVKNNAAVRYNCENPSTLVQGKPVPKTNLNIGMDFWNASAAGATPVKTRLNASGASPLVSSATMVGREGILHDHQLYQDERELKREKRKQSNRESARRSRLRKLAECEELQVKVDKLNNENQTMRDEMQRLAEECEKLTSDNNSIMEELAQLYGPDAISLFQGSHHNGALQSVDGDDNSLGPDTSTENNSNSISGQNGHFSNGKHDS